MSSVLLNTTQQAMKRVESFDRMIRAIYFNSYKDYSHLFCFVFFQNCLNGDKQKWSGIRKLFFQPLESYIL